MIFHFYKNPVRGFGPLQWVRFEPKKKIQDPAWTLVNLYLLFSLDSSSSSWDGHSGGKSKPSQWTGKSSNEMLVFIWFNGKIPWKWRIFHCHSWILGHSWEPWSAVWWHWDIPHLAQNPKRKQLEKKKDPVSTSKPHNFLSKTQKKKSPQGTRYSTAQAS